MPFYFWMLHGLPFFQHVAPVVHAHFHCFKLNPVMKHYYATHPFFNLACKGA